MFLRFLAGDRSACTDSEADVEAEEKDKHCDSCDVGLAVPGLPLVGLRDAALGVTPRFDAGDAGM